MACETSGVAPTLCMNDFSSASPKVIVPRQISETRAPDPPSGRYFMMTSAESAQDQARVRAAEAEAVRDDVVDAPLARAVRHVVEIALGVGRRVVDRRRDPPARQRERAERRLDAARRAQH